MLALLGFLVACTIYLAANGALVGSLVMGALLLSFATIRLRPDHTWRRHRDR